MKNEYKVWAQNNSGASTDVARGAVFTSIKAAVSAARAEMGSGWKIHVENQNGEIVKSFTIR